MKFTHYIFKPLCYSFGEFSLSLNTNMKPFRFFLILAFGLGVCTQSHANDFEAALGSETAQFTFRSDSSLIGWGGADLGFGIFYNEESDFVTQFELIQRRQASSQTPLTLGVGVKFYAGNIDATNDDIFALGIGAEIRYTFPGVMPSSIYLRGYFAPEITSFGDTEEVADYNLGFQIEVLPQTSAFVGIRHIEVDSKNLRNLRNYDLDDDRIHFGVRLTF